MPYCNISAETWIKIGDVRQPCLNINGESYVLPQDMSRAEAQKIAEAIVAEAKAAVIAKITAAGWVKKESEPGGSR